jgi:hypothetical protein
MIGSKALDRLLDTLAGLLGRMGTRYFDPKARRERQVKRLLKRLLKSERWPKRHFETMRELVRGSGFTDADLRRFLIELGAARFIVEEPAPPSPPDRPVPVTKSEAWGLVDRPEVKKDMDAAPCEQPPTPPGEDPPFRGLAC